MSNKSQIQKCLKYPIGGVGGQAYLGHCPKFSCFLIMTPPLRLFGTKMKMIQNRELRHTSTPNEENLEENKHLFNSMHHFMAKINLYVSIYIIVKLHSDLQLDKVGVDFIFPPSQLTKK